MKFLMGFFLYCIFGLTFPILAKPYIDLSKQNFFVVDHFKKSYIQNFNISQVDTKIAKLPIILDSIFSHTSIRHASNSKRTSFVKQYTLYTEFILSREDLKYPLILQLGGIGENWAVYINGNLIRKEIYLHTSHKIRIYRKLQNITIPINSLFLKEGKNTLLFRIIGNTSPIPFLSYRDTGLFLKHPYLITVESQLKETYVKQAFLGISVIYIFFGIYHFFLYLRRRKESYNFYFSVFALLFGIYNFSLTPYVYEIIFDSYYISKMNYASQPLLIPVFLMFFHRYVFPGKRFHFFLFFFFWIEVTLMIYFLIMPQVWLDFGMRIFYISAIFLLIYAIFFLIKIGKHSNRIAKIMIYSSFFLILITGIEIFDALILHYGIHLTRFVFFIFIILIIISMVYHTSVQYQKTILYSKYLLKQKNAFLRFVPKQVLFFLGKRKFQDIDYGDYKRIYTTVMIFDLEKVSKNFRGTENHLLIFLNNYFSLIEPIVKKYGGFIDKYMGNYILTTFPESTNHHQFKGKFRVYSSVESTFLCALEIQKELVHINLFREQQKDFRIDIFSVIHFGETTLGTVGSSDRIDTTIIGDTVNTVSRLDDVAKLYHCKIVCTVETINYLIKRLRIPRKNWKKEYGFFFHLRTLSESYYFRYIDTIQLKGKTEPTVIYEIYNEEDPAFISREKSILIFYKGLHYYYKQEFSKAIKCFQSSLDIMPNDRVYRIYLVRSEVFLSRKPPTDWQGVFHLKTKGFL